MRLNFRPSLLLMIVGIVLSIFFLVACQIERTPADQVEDIDNSPATQSSNGSQEVASDGQQNVGVVGSSVNMQTEAGHGNLVIVSSIGENELPLSEATVTIFSNENDI